MIGGAVSPNERLQLRIQPWSSYVIVPLFVLANAGVKLDADHAGRRGALPDHLGDHGRAGRRQAGRGERPGTWIALKTRVGRVPDTLVWGQLIGGAAVCGIGFTVALFVTELALDDPLLQAEAKIGILAGSTIAALLGWVIFRYFGDRGGQCFPSDLPSAAAASVAPSGVNVVEPRRTTAWGWCTGPPPPTRSPDRAAAARPGSS